MMSFLLNTFIFASITTNCTWNYRFDSTNNHFNIVYPDKNAVYFGMIIPPGTSNFTIASDNTQFTNLNIPVPVHPTASYFSLQLYNSNDIVTSEYHYTDVDLLTLDGLTKVSTPYKQTIMLETEGPYFALFRIYNSQFPLQNANWDMYWSGLPPKTYLDGVEYCACDIDYEQQGNIYTNISNSVRSDTGTVCINNEEFIFMEAPPGSLMNCDANYMIACIKPNTSYRVSIQMPRLSCSNGYNEHQPKPWINEQNDYDMRYVSLSLVATTAPRPTVETISIPCDVDHYETTIHVGNETQFPGLLYRQLLPNPEFKYSIENAKQKCYDHVDSKYDVICIQKQMGKYYPKLERVDDYLRKNDAL
jgi:hypothetical protein